MTLKDAGKLSGLWIGVATNYLANLNLKNAFKYWNEINDTQFNLYTAENYCKNYYMYASWSKGKGCKYLYDKSRKLKGAFRGHAVVWHRQLGNDYSKLYPLKNGKFDVKYMENHVKYILKSYPDAWAIDVVNEAVDDWPVKWRKDSTKWYAGTENDRNNPETIPEYIKKAFQFTRKHSPNAKLGYNDYNIANIGDKANFIVKFVKKMKKTISL